MMLAPVNGKAGAHLAIENLHVRIAEKDILRGVELAVPPGEVHALMGPNGSGKSTLAHVLAGREGFQPAQGKITYDGRDMTQMTPEERARAGVFLAFQTPVDLPGVNAMVFLRTALNAQKRARGEDEMNPAAFLRLARETAERLGMAQEMFKREVNVGFSGGEKKRFEMLQMALFAPRLAILDEIDSGLDVDALKLVARVVDSVRAQGCGVLLITHYQRLLDHVQPDKVHILAGGRIARSGDAGLAREVEATGYARFEEAAP